jgi:hypothetical protein
MRAYGEINDFEAALRAPRRGAGQVLAGGRQGRAVPPLQARERWFKRFKITDEDWRNREKWDAYEAAVCDMVDRTSTAHAPWTLVEANNKYHARIKVLRTLCEAVEARSTPRRQTSARSQVEAGKETPGGKRSKR